MSRKTRAPKHLFAEDGIISGEYEIDGGYELRRTHASTGDLRQLEYVLESDYGSARYTMLGGDHYFFNWGSYFFRGGLSYTARLDQPFVQLHFQLQGSARVARSILGVELFLARGITTSSSFQP